MNTRAKPSSVASKAVRTILPPHLRKLPGLPIPRGAGARKSDLLRRMRDWGPLLDISREFARALGDHPAARAGAAMAVFFASGWVELVIEVEPPAEREKLKEAMWIPPLRIGRSGEQEWLVLTLELRNEARHTGVSDDEMLTACQAFAHDMQRVADGDYDGHLYHFDGVVIELKRAVSSAAKRLGFSLNNVTQIAGGRAIERQ